MSGSSTIQSNLVVTTPLAFAELPLGKAKTTFVISNTTDCWTLHILLTQSQFNLVKSTGDQLRLKVCRTDDPSIQVTRAGGFLASPTIKISTDTLSQGYGACRFPGTSDDEPFIAGSWTATLVSQNGAFQGLVVADVLIWLVERRIQVPSPIPSRSLDTFALPIKFVLVTPRFKSSEANSLWTSAISSFKSIFTEREINVVVKNKIAKVAETPYVSDLRTGDLAALVTEHSTSDAITIFTLINLEIRVDGAVGFAMLPGPQGFQCSHSAVLTRMKRDSVNENKDTLGRRMAHEVGHYLGLVHESSCLDSARTGDDMAVCQLALGRQNPATGNLIQGNLMFTSSPGARLGNKQVYQLRRSPFITRTINLPRTRVKSLVITVHTGIGIKNAWDFIRMDYAGTDDDVIFQLFGPTGARLLSRDVSSWGNDFEQGDVTDYQLDPGTTLYEEDIVGFRIVKTFAVRPGVFTVDDWLLQGLAIKINDRVWYSRDDIHTWLQSSLNSDGSFSAPLSRPALDEQVLATQHVGIKVTTDLADPPLPPPFYVTPPFSRYPTSLQFALSASSRCATSISWSDLMGPDISPSDGRHPFSWQTWIRPTQTQLEQAIIAVGEDQNRIFIRIKGGRYEFGAITSGQEAVASAAIPPGDIDRWIHVCGSYDGTYWTIHRNGSAMVQSQAGALPIIHTVVSIGAYGDPVSGCLNAQLRNVAIWKAGRSADEEMRDLFRIDTSDPNLAAYWPLDDGEGAQPYDASPAANDLTLTGATWAVPLADQADTLYLSSSPTTAVGPAPSAPFVLINGAKLFSAFTTADTTIGGWFRIGSAANNEPTERVLAASGDLVLRYRDGRYQFGLKGIASDLLSVLTPAGDVAHWVHLVGQYNATARTWTLIRNGHLLARQDAIQGYSGPSSGCVWTLGGETGGQAVSSAHSLELRLIVLFHGVLSMERLRSTYMNPLQVLPPSPDFQADGLVGYWPADDGLGDVLYDQSVIDADTDPTTAANGVFDPAFPGGLADEVAAVWTTSGPIPTFLFVETGGQSIDAAIRLAITDAGPTKPYTLHLGPGTFTEQVMLPPWCSLVGAGQEATEIISMASATGPGSGYAAVEMFGSQTIRQLTVSSAGSGNTWGATLVAIGFNSGSDVLLDNVTAQGIHAAGQGINIRVVSINQLSGGPFRYYPAARFVAVNCTFKVDTNTWGEVLLVAGSDVTLSTCTITGGIQGVRTAWGGVSGRKTTLYNCVVHSSTALDGDGGTLTIAHGCQLLGTIGRNVTILPS